MTAFRCSAKSLAALAPSAEGPAGERLGLAIAEHLRVTSRVNPSAAERRSWARSLLLLARDLLEAGLDDVEMLVEYQLPLTSKRVDVVLAGVNRRTGEDAYVVVELKQWGKAVLFEDDPQLVMVNGAPLKPMLHPLLQVRGYCEYITDFVGFPGNDRDALHGVVYLHNASDSDIKGLYELAQDEQTRLFSATTRKDFIEYLRDRFAPAPGGGAGRRFLASDARPSKQLFDLAASELRELEQYVLLAEQRLGYELVMHSVDEALGKTFTENKKTIIIVTGGPGSGKSAIGLSLLGELSRQGRSVLHATGSRSFTESLRRVVGKGSSSVKSLFKYNNSFVGTEQNGIDVLICDEAHRIRETSMNRYTPARLRTDRAQIDELIDVARVPVFLLDEHQAVRPGEIGTVEEIRNHAIFKGVHVHLVRLDAQFRHGGSRKYETWVSRLLGLDGGNAPELWTGDDRFTVQAARSPYELEGLLRGKLDDGCSARMTAGFCWPWSDPGSDETLVPDVVIGEWARPWNVKGDRAVGNAPASALWATMDGGFEQVGCVYTAQGFEYDWNGVIIGPDLVARNGRLVTVRRASRDPAMTRGVTDAQADRLIRNTYKVLLTRGMVGTAIYAVDPETQRFLTGLIEGHHPRVGGV
ncbi:DUF2075 domain-containing protein [Streptosporangium roseum]|uniref:DUF2075 domain-containing protein n=1 Tax=Streptosporangium roseum TaxID=2001 RepID=UPI0004CD2E2C|nr:DUF2075 domain-containing protein [Streptosporangium roseum]